VTFFDGTTAIGTGHTAGGIATFSTSSLTAKTHNIKAAYAGDSVFDPSIGGVKQVVDKYATATSLNSSLNPSQFGQAVMFTARVTSSGPTLTGRVKFLDGTTAIGSATLSSGVATLTKSTLAVGTHPITAEYLGDADNAESTSPVLDQVVQ
jgi:large repetitive protein